MKKLDFYFGNNKILKYMLYASARFLDIYMNDCIDYNHAVVVNIKHLSIVGYY